MEKSWNSGKWQNHFSDLETSWNLKIKIMEKSWNFKIHHGTIMEFGLCEIFSHATIEIFLHATRAIGHFHFVQIIHGKIMEFHFGKWLETLFKS